MGVRAMLFVRALLAAASHMGQFMAEKPVRRGKARGRRLETLDIGDDFCTSMNINRGHRAQRRRL
ncbi:hypothetical protein JL721_10361 [Aureococcus anophagefferens]|nr:hypothetical protein JL721_10361 [Aureococcus anophagefferens]